MRERGRDREREGNTKGGQGVWVNNLLRSGSGRSSARERRLRDVFGRDKEEMNAKTQVRYASP